MTEQYLYYVASNKTYDNYVKAKKAAKALMDKTGENFLVKRRPMADPVLKVELEPVAKP
jgi:hypothetical protein